MDHMVKALHAEPEALAKANVGASGLPRQGKEFWRSLEELSDSAAFQEKVRQEFPHSADYWSDPITRRRFLMHMGASLGLAGLSGCSTSAPQQPILPYVR